MMVFPFECISFYVPSQVQITPMKFVAVKSVPKIICLVICLQTINDSVKGVLLILNVKVTCPNAPIFSPVDDLTMGW